MYNENEEKDLHEEQNHGQEEHKNDRYDSHNLERNFGNKSYNVEDIQIEIDPEIFKQEVKQEEVKDGTGETPFNRENDSYQRRDTGSYSFWDEQRSAGAGSEQSRNNNDNYNRQTEQNSQYRFTSSQIHQYEQMGNGNTGYNGQNHYGQPGNGQFGNGQNFGGQNYERYAEQNNSPNFSKESGDDKKGKKKKSTGKKIGGLVGAAVLFGVIAGFTFQGVNYLSGNFGQDRNVISNNTVPKENEIPEEEKIQSTAPIPNTSKSTIKAVTDVSGIVEDVMPSIVSITSTVTETGRDFFGTPMSRDYEGSGSGIIIGKDDKELLIVTNNHVIESANRIKVKFIDDKIASAELKGKDTMNDLAVISIKLKDIDESSLEAIEVASLGSSEDIKVGEMAIAIGNAMGYGQSVTVGYVSAKDRQLQVEDKSMVLLQTDAAINPGNSGGALLNVKGEVIGINTVKVASNEVEGMGYAIPISKALPIIDDLMTKEVIEESEQGFLGITGNTIDKDNALNLPQGAYVMSVYEGSAGHKAGVLQGDIITKVNDVEITTFEALREKVNGYKIGTEVKITLVRMVDGSYKDIEVTAKLGKAPVVEETQESANPQTEEEDGYNYYGDDYSNPYGNNSPYGGNSDSMEDFYSEFFDYFN